MSRYCFFFLLLFRCYQFFIFSPWACSDWSTQTWFFFPHSRFNQFHFPVFFSFPISFTNFSKVIIVCVPCCNRILVTFTLCFSFISSIIVDWHQHTVLYNIYIHIGCGNTSSPFGTWHFFSRNSYDNVWLPTRKVYPNMTQDIVQTSTHSQIRMLTPAAKKERDERRKKRQYWSLDGDKRIKTEKFWSSSCVSSCSGMSLSTSKQDSIGWH